MSIFEYNEEEELKKIRASEFQVGKAEGIIEGKSEGLAEGLAKGKAESVLELLEESGSLPDELRNRILQEKNPEQLTKWLKDAAKASSIDNFMKKL